MTRQEYIAICSMCTKRSFDPKHGIICGLTNAPADFSGNCKDYDEDIVEVKHKKLNDNYETKQTKKGINKGRIALFVIGGFYLLIGFYEAFFILGADLLFGIIDWVLAAVFIGLGVLSYSKASLSLMLGLGFYILIILLLAAIEPLTLLSGIIWKIIFIVWLVYGISAARKEEAGQKNVDAEADLLDQL